MPEIGQYWPTLADYAKSVDPNGAPARVVELLNQTNEVLDDMPMQEGNLPTGHRTTVRTDLPSGVWQKLNYGLLPSKGLTAQVDDTCGRFGCRSEIDLELLNLNGNSSGWMMNQQIPFFETMNQTMASGLFYNDTAVNPERFLGLSARYPTSNTANVLSAGGTGNYNTSIWLICWSPTTVYSIAPKGLPAGIEHEFIPREKIYDTQTPQAGSLYAAINTWTWRLGLVVEDWRYIVRLANINATGLGANILNAPTTNFFNLDMLWAMIGTLPTLRVMKGRPAFYMHRALWTWLNIQAMNKTNAALGWTDVFGQKVLTFQGIPIRQVDQLLLTETAI